MKPNASIVARNCLSARLMSLLLLAACALTPTLVAAQAGVGPSAKADIAVWDFTLTGVGDSEGQAIANRLRSELVSSDLFRIMSRNQLRTLLGELELGQTLGDPQSAIRAGKLKGVRYVVTGSVVAVGNAVQVTAELIDGETAEILMSVTPRPFKGDLIDYLDIEVPYLAQRLSGVEQQRAEAQRSEGYAAARSGERWRLYTGMGLALGGLAVLAKAHATAADAGEQAASARATLDYPGYQAAADTMDRAELLEVAGFMGLLVSASMLAEYFGFSEAPTQRRAQVDPPPSSMTAGITSDGVSVGYRWRF